LNWFWPQSVAPEPSFGQRLGRLCHWTSLLIAAGLLALGAIDYSSNPSAQTVAIIVGLALLIAMAGRGLRYLFGGE